MPENEIDNILSNDDEIGQILSLYYDAIDDKNRWNSHLDEAYSYIYSDHTSFDIEDSYDETIRHHTIYDSTAVFGVEDAADQMQYYLMPPQLQWADLEFKDINLDEKTRDQKLLEKKQLQTLNDTLFTHIHRSNLDEAIFKALKDLQISTAVIYVQHGQDGEMFDAIAVHLKYICFSVYPNGKEKDIFYTRFLTADDIKREYDYQINSTGNKASSNIRYKVVACYVVKDLDTVHEELKGTTYVHQYTILIEGKVLLSEEKMAMMPFVIARLDYSFSERYGKGTVIKRLSDIRRLNKILKYEDSSLNLKYAGGYIEAEGLEDCIVEKNIDGLSVKVSPKNQILVRHGGSLESVMPRPIPPSYFDIHTMTHYTERKEELKKEFMLEPLGDVMAVGGRLTATEVTIRQNAFIKKQSGMFSRLENQVAKPIINLCLYLMATKDDHSDFEKLLKADKIRKNINVSFRSKIHDIEKADKFQKLLQFVQATSSTSPDAMHTEIDIEETVRLYSDYLNIDPSVLLSSEKKEIIMQRLQEMAKQQENVNLSDNRQDKKQNTKSKQDKGNNTKGFDQNQLNDRIMETGVN